MDCALTAVNGETRIALHTKERALNIKDADKMPAVHAEVFITPGNTLYLQKPGVVMVSRPHVNLSGVAGFLAGFDRDLKFPEYLDDPTPISGTEALIKFAGQLCYYSFGANRTFNEKADEYFKNIKSSRHGSVCEHGNFSFLIYGVPRSFTHELVRHRAGAAFSQVSQRYVDGSTLRFVERPASAADPELHKMFLDWIDLSSVQYEKRAARLLALQQSGFAGLIGEKKRDLRKKINQDARACLPNEAEAPIFVTLNVRALRHVIEMRADSPADIEIRAVAMTLYSMALSQAPLLFNDYTVVPQPDGFPAVSTEYRKV